MPCCGIILLMLKLEPEYHFACLSPQGNGLSGQAGITGKVLKEHAPSLLAPALTQSHRPLFLESLRGTTEDFGMSYLIFSPALSNQYFCCPLFGDKEKQSRRGYVACPRPRSSSQLGSKPPLHSSVVSPCPGFFLCKMGQS